MSPNRTQGAGGGRRALHPLDLRDRGALSSPRTTLLAAVLLVGGGLAACATSADDSRLRAPEADTSVSDTEATDTASPLDVGGDVRLDVDALADTSADTTRDSIATSDAPADADALAADVVRVPPPCDAGIDTATAPADDAATDALIDDASSDATFGDSDASDAAAADIGPGPSCEGVLPTGFVCGPVVKKAGSRECKESDLKAFAKACFTALGGSASDCTAWRSANPACAKCTLDIWTSPTGQYQRDACYYTISTPVCGRAISCYFECVHKVCDSCTTRPEHLECQSHVRRAPSGQCYDVAYAAAERGKCFGAAVKPCFISELGKARPDPKVLLEQVLVFFRGACRDNADWRRATSADPLDGGC